MTKRSADENLRMIMSDPALSVLACAGTRDVAASPMSQAVASLYERVASYPAGYLWISAHDDECHRDDFVLPDYDIFSRKDQRRLMRMFDKHLLRRKRLLEGLLAKLQRGESLPEVEA